MVINGVELTGFCSEDIRSILSGVDCVLAFETASDYLGTNKMTHQRPALYVYSLEQLNLDGVECTIVDSYDNLDIVNVRGIFCTSVTQTLFDLLRNDRDEQVIIEAMADWYFDHNESFDTLIVPNDIRHIFNSYVDDAVHYFDE